MQLRIAAVLGLAIVIDVAAGEYPSALHPVVWMGRCISFLERWAPAAGKLWQLAWGAMTAIAVPLVFAAGAALLVLGSRRLGWAGVPLEALALKSTFALRELGRAGARVREALGRGALGEAREGLKALCSRDSSQLDPPRLAAAAIESLGENASDSVIAPIFWYLLLGLPGAFAYRTANTLDARIGYHGRYEWLGKPAARLDDLWNLVPARLTALLLLGAGLLCGADARRGARVLLRDGRKTESPNAGRPMAALAGLLGVELEKVGHYRLGDPVRPLGPEQIGAAWRIVSLAAVLAVSVSVAVLGALDALA
ncbi:MAG TPA: adenosylcobinamide-phosphate synthase CbiB [Anaeromyxobacter sp.]